jgi:hypothetical protein
MTTSLRFLVSDSTLKAGGESKPAFKGQLVMKVWWANGRETQTVCENYGKAYDVIGGEAHPFDKWEIWGVVEALKPGDYIVVSAGCRALGINKHATAVIREIKELGAEYSHQVSVQIQMTHGGKVHSLTAVHINRLSEPTFNLLNPWRSGQKIQVRRR